MPEVEIQIGLLERLDDEKKERIRSSMMGILVKELADPLSVSYIDFVETKKNKTRNNEEPFWEIGWDEDNILGGNDGQR